MPDPPRGIVIRCLTPDAAEEEFLRSFIEYGGE
jgi:hypothetical protein